MALVVFDRGARIETPVRSLFPSRRVDPTSAPAAEPALPGTDNNPRAELEQLSQDYEALNRQLDSRHEELRAYRDISTQGQSTRREQALTASTIMTTPVETILLTDSLESAERRLNELGINHLVVTASDGQPIGMLSRDQIIATPHKQDSVEHHCRYQFVVASPDTPVPALAADLVNFHIGAVPVFAADNRLLGIITRTDLLRLLISRARIEGWA